MRYFVIAPDGSKYGPADLATLRAWVIEGRISPETILEEAASHQRAPARMVAGLFPNEGSPFAAQPHIRTPQTEYTKGSGNGNGDVIWSYLCSAMSIICCGFFIIGAFVYANRAISKGNPSGKAAKIVAYVFLLLYIILSILTVMFFNQVLEFLKQQMSGTGMELPE